MNQLAEPKHGKYKREVKTNTQTFMIQEIWKKMPKTEYNKETNELKKVNLKGELYSKISQLYQEQEGKEVKRSTVRRCVNSIMKAK